MSKKERYCIKNGKLYDRDTCVGYISEYQDETYVDMLNCLDEQLTEGAQHTEIQNLRKQLTEKDKEIEELKLEAMRWEEHFNNARMDYQCLEEDKNKEIAELRKRINKKDKNKRHQICEEIKIAMTSIEPNCSIEDMNSDLYEFTGKEIYAILDTIEQAKR